MASIQNFVEGGIIQAGQQRRSEDTCVRFAAIKRAGHWSVSRLQTSLTMKVEFASTMRRFRVTPSLSGSHVLTEKVSRQY